MDKSEDKGKDIPGIFFWRAFYVRIRIYTFLNKLVHLICLIRGVKIGKNVQILGLPRIRRFPGSIISIGNKCVINSAKHSDLFGLIKPCTFVTFNRNAAIVLGNNVGITGLMIGSASRVQIGNNVRIGAQCAIFDTDFHHPDPNVRLNNDKMPSSPVHIEDNVFIGYNCVILKGVTIGENSVIGANSVVFNNIPKDCIAVGNPCKVVIRKNWNSPVQ